MSVPECRRLFTFAEKGISRTGLTDQEIQRLFDGALESANQELGKRGYSLFLVSHLPIDPKPRFVDPTRNLLLGIRLGDREELIDMIDMKALDETELKSSEDLALEMIRKARHHLACRETQGIIFSSSGSKFDRRLFSDFTIDAEGYLLILKNRVVSPTMNGYWVIKAESLRSYTSQVFIQLGRILRIVDDYDLVRSNQKGMYVDITESHRIAPVELLEKCRPDAERFQGEYFELKRDVLSDGMRAALKEELLKVRK